MFAKRPELDLARIDRTVQLIDQSLPVCLVTGYAHLVDELDSPDPENRHVLAAAIRAGHWRS